MEQNNDNNKINATKLETQVYRNSRKHFMTSYLYVDFNYSCLNSCVNVLVRDLYNRILISPHLKHFGLLKCSIAFWRK